MTVAIWRKAAVALSVGAAVLTGGTALAQNGKSNNNQNNRGNRNAPPDPNAPLVDRLLPKGKTKQWQLMVDIYYPGLAHDAPPLNKYGVVRPDYNLMGKHVLPGEWSRIAASAEEGVKFDTAAMVFPVPLATAGHTSSMGTFSSEIKIDGRTLTTDPPKFTEGYQAGERLARWDLHNVEGRRLNLHIEIPVTCWELGFNEEEAAKVEWPKGDWPPDAKSALEPVYLVEWAEEEHEIADSKKALDDLLKRWLKGRDPKAMKPIALAKELAGDVQELLNPGAGDTVVYNASANFAGLLCQTVTEMLSVKRVYDLSSASFLAALYREVGLPARTVYGYNMTDKRDPKAGARGHAEMTAWVEFAVMDEKTGAVVWVPVDIVEMRKNGSRMQRLDKPWKFFGSNENMVYMIPISFHAHPPTGVSVRSLPAFWGWLCTPETPPLPHSLKIQAMSQDSAEKKRNDEEDKRNKNKPKRP